MRMSLRRVVVAGCGGEHYEQLRTIGKQPAVGRRMAAMSKCQPLCPPFSAVEPAGDTGGLRTSPDPDAAQMCARIARFAVQLTQACQMAQDTVSAVPKVFCRVCQVCCRILPSLIVAARPGALGSGTAALRCVRSRPRKSRPATCTRLVSSPDAAGRDARRQAGLETPRLNTVPGRRCNA
jgi:hypothetical protein